MISLNEIIRFLELICPTDLGEEWDNVGFLVGNRDRKIERVMTCLTVTPDVVSEGIEKKADLIVSHHPFPFRGAKRWTSETTDGRVLLRLIEGNLSVYSPHTAHDSAFYGINRQLALELDLEEVIPLSPAPLEATYEMLEGVPQKVIHRLSGEVGRPLGTGRIGRLKSPLSLSALLERVRHFLHLDGLAFFGDRDRLIETVAIGCGAADDFIPLAAECGADLLLLGEARFHAVLEAKSLGLSLILPGHYATERFAMERLAERLDRVFPDVTVWASEMESDPLQYFIP